ncbi:protein of unknown function, might belong to Tryptophanase [Moritella yayanosii]|uniref:Uncharacterized protein n=1 Tax=Moritella yayanosii TaxID=69539 RepID=A0A330LQ09_9GAMM|nr:protein of unknown function, might belong to Tryptophanase [Moritella yayanosii]
MLPNKHHYIPVLINKREMENGLDRKKMVALSNYFALRFHVPRIRKPIWTLLLKHSKK